MEACDRERRGRAPLRMSTTRRARGGPNRVRAARAQVWNEDFLRALRISNVSVSQISRWEINFLKLIDFNTNVERSDYVDATFRLQERYSRERGELLAFFTFLMNACSPQMQQQQQR